MYIHMYISTTFNFCERINANIKYFFQGKTRGSTLCKKISFKERSTKHDFSLFLFGWFWKCILTHTYIHMYISISFVMIVNPNNLREPVRALISKSTWCAWHSVWQANQTYLYKYMSILMHARTYVRIYVCIYACKYNTLPGQLLYKHN